MTERPRWPWWLLVLVPVVAGVVVVVLAASHGRGSSDGSATSASATTTPTSPDPPPVVVSAVSSVHATDLPSLVRASTAVVIGRVTSTERGRVVGEPGGEAIVTRLVRLAVDEVLAGDDPGPEIVVEEEGWLPDGAPILVNGVRGSQVGDHGIFFVVRVDAEEGPTWVTLGDQGRYLADPADGTRQLDLGVDDPLVRQLRGQDPAWLRHQVQAAAAAVGRSPSTQG